MQIEYRCEWCGAPFMGRPPHPSRRTRRYCGQPCWRAARVSVESSPDRFWSKVSKATEPDGCWTWTARRNALGYGQVTPRYGSRWAHRVAYALTIGPIPAGLELDHLCRNPWCVNPAHLEPVTHRENMRRGHGAAAMHARKTHCDHGHPFDDANTRITPRGVRRCRTCHRRWEAERRARRADLLIRAAQEGAA